MSRENDLDLDAILAEFHAGEQRPAAPAEPPAPRRRGAESATVTEGSLSAPAPQQPPAKPTQKPQPSPKPERERRPASRKAGGRLRMAIVLAALLAILAGMLFRVSREERKAAALEPEPQRIELGQGLEDYLDHAASTSYG